MKADSMAPVSFRKKDLDNSIPKSPVFYLQRAKACREKLLADVHPRALHDFRTSLRRLEAILRLERPLLEKNLVKREIERIKYLQGLTGPLREADVSSKILRSMGFSPISSVTGRSESQEEKERAFQEILAYQAFDQLFLDIERTFQGIERRKKFQKKVRSSFWKEMGRIMKALETYDRKGTKRKILHHLRIRAKRLRYDLELFDFLRPAKRKKLLKAANDVQDVLGSLRDLQGTERLLEEPRVIRVRKDLKALEALRNRKRTLVSRARKAIGSLERAVD